MRIYRNWIEWKIAIKNISMVALNPWWKMCIAREHSRIQSICKIQKLTSEFVRFRICSHLHSTELYQFWWSSISSWVAGSHVNNEKYARQKLKFQFDWNVLHFLPFDFSVWIFLIFSYLNSIFSIGHNKSREKKEEPNETLKWKWFIWST